MSGAVGDIPAAARRRGTVTGGLALGVALALFAGPVLLAVITRAVLGHGLDPRWAVAVIPLQATAMVLPAVMGATAAARGQQRRLGIAAVVTSIAGNYALLAALAFVYFALGAVMVGF